MTQLLIRSSLAMLALCALSLDAKPPAGWFMAGNKPLDYECNTDPLASYQGLPSVQMKSVKPAIEGFGSLMQSIGPDQYKGKRIRYSANVRSVGVDGPGSWAGLWMRVDKDTKAIAFDNMEKREVKGTTEWKRYEVVLDVAEDATGISFGMILAGTGNAWINGAKFEVVDRTVPVTDMTTKPTTGPVNLNFDK